MLSAYQLPVASNPTVDFLEALATNEASATVSLVLPLRDPFWFIRAISIVAVQNLAYELMLFDSATNIDGTLDGDHFNAVWQFGPLVVGPPASPGWPIDTPEISPDSGFYRYYVDGNMMPYFDFDQMQARSQASGGEYPKNARLHVRLINRSATAKEAGAPGALKITFYCATQGMQV